MDKAERIKMARALANSHRSVMQARQEFHDGLREIKERVECPTLRSLLNDLSGEYSGLSSMLRLALVQLDVDIRVFVERNEVRFKDDPIQAEIDNEYLPPLFRILEPVETLSDLPDQAEDHDSVFVKAEDIAYVYTEEHGWEKLPDHVARERGGDDDIRGRMERSGEQE